MVTRSLGRSNAFMTMFWKASRPGVRRGPESGQDSNAREGLVPDVT